VARLLTRRSFARRSLAAFGAVAAAGLGAAQGAPARRARGDLSAERERTYGALVGAVALAQGARADSAHLKRVAGGFRAWYRASLPHVRASVDATLDDLERRAGGRFAAMSRQRRAELLRKLGAPATAAHAVSLASPPFAPYDDGLPLFGGMV
jgi:hypothetical protein